MGPEGGSGGGLVVATGTPEEVAQVEGSFTGQYLKKVLKQWEWKTLETMEEVVSKVFFRIKN